MLYLSLLRYPISDNSKLGYDQPGSVKKREMHGIIKLMCAILREYACFLFHQNLHVLLLQN